MDAGEEESEGTRLLAVSSTEGRLVGEGSRRRRNGRLKLGRRKVAKEGALMEGGILIVVVVLLLPPGGDMVVQQLQDRGVCESGQCRSQRSTCMALAIRGVGKEAGEVGLDILSTSHAGVLIKSLDLKL